MRMFGLAASLGLPTEKQCRDGARARQHGSNQHGDPTVPAWCQSRAKQHITQTRKTDFD